MSKVASQFHDLTREERLLLMRFVCSFAWADHEVRPEERQLVSTLVRRLDLDKQEVEQVEAWLEEPPTPETVNPEQVPRQHRMVFLRALESVITVDGEVTPSERQALIHFAKLAP
jgi:uncharacterized tellurite resistance protein B-like protein